MSTIGALELHELSILESRRAMESGEATAYALAERYLERIEELDQNGPNVNSVIELNPDALATAAALDEERRTGHVRGPLHGVSIVIKDNIDTHDRMQTTAGSLALEGSIAPRDAFVVERLRDAGAVILGKTNLSEWANFRGERSVSGWSSRGGLTRNPYALDRSACGSSSGSGAAVAADLCAAAVGTETDGSIICPSQINGIVGIKPTVGLVSRRGIVPISRSQDTAGPMARTVSDAAILLGAMAGADDDDIVTRTSRRRASRDYEQCLDGNGLKGARIGVARALAGSDPHVLSVFGASLDVMRELGAVIVDPVEVPAGDQLEDAELVVLYHEFKAGLNRYLRARGPEAGVRSLADVIAFNEEHASSTMPYFGQEHMEIALRQGPLTSTPYREALSRNRRLARRGGIDAALRKHRLAAIALPSGSPAWTVDLIRGDPNNGDVDSTTLAAVAGYPHVTVPAGHIFGLPVGLSFLGGAWQEPTLIKLAYAFEQAARVRRPPRFLPQADLRLGRQTP